MQIKKPRGNAVFLTFKYRTEDKPKNKTHGGKKDTA